MVSPEKRGFSCYQDPVYFAAKHKETKEKNFGSEIQPDRSGNIMVSPEKRGFSCCQDPVYLAAQRNQRHRHKGYRVTEEDFHIKG